MQSRLIGNGTLPTQVPYRNEPPIRTSRCQRKDRAKNPTTKYVRLPA